MAKIPDPFIGPKGVRILLVLRGIGGCAFFIEDSFDVIHTMYSLIQLRRGIWDLLLPSILVSLRRYCLDLLRPDLHSYFWGYLPGREFQASGSNGRL